VIIIISPSGNLYGSENVLFDYLKCSSLNFNRIFVPRGSQFDKKLKVSGYNSFGFTNLKILYLKISWLLILKQIRTLYCNEGGHVKYILLLAKIFPKVNFILHVRIIEDTVRIKKTPRNVIVIAISKTITNRLNSPSQLIYDGYEFKKMLNWTTRKQSQILKVGIVGRVTKSKGITLFTEKFIEKAGSNVEFHFFGDIDIDFQNSEEFKILKSMSISIFHGFISEKNIIYGSIDLLLHLNENEPLGRIFFESLDFGIPFIGIHNGGIGEIAELIDYPYTFSKEEIPYILNQIVNSKMEFDIFKLENSRKLARDIFSIKKYSNHVDYLLK
jgi:hypothetical protein